MRQLLIYHNEVRAGVLTEMEPGSNYRFEYDKEYLNSPLPPISITLPKTRFFLRKPATLPLLCQPFARRSLATGGVPRASYR